jgi:hypothetical protein
MAKTAERTDPKLWEEVKAEVKQGSKGGEAGEWSASKARLAVQEYKKRGGGYHGRKNRQADERDQPREARAAHAAEAKPEARSEAGANSEPPARARERRAIIAGPQPMGGEASAPSKAALMRQAKMLEIEGRSRMTKEDLAKAIRYARH